MGNKCGSCTEDSLTFGNAMASGGEKNIEIISTNWDPFMFTSEICLQRILANPFLVISRVWHSFALFLEDNGVRGGICLQRIGANPFVVVSHVWHLFAHFFLEDNGVRGGAGP